MAARPAVAERIHELIISGYSNKEIAEIIRREIPGAKTDSKGAASYRYCLRKSGHDVMSSRKALKSKSSKVLAVAHLPAKSAMSSRLHHWMQSWF